MGNDFATSLGEFGLHIGMKLIGKAMEPSREINTVALANAILEASVEQASDIVSRLGVNAYIEHSTSEQHATQQSMQPTAEKPRPLEDDQIGPATAREVAAAGQPHAITGSMWLKLSKGETMSLSLAEVVVLSECSGDAAAGSGSRRD